ncbi:sigma factor-like helix-turn-helix DNA-binding protein [Pedobacter gandavensis]|uniref:sigma factor-like helix-turn-helix DNA-binding protein n=1 Tax=Pedobacter gandavensis TaxID=2679963 RepID=UPI00292EB79E|nr:sigma factor-like helix-turn-helix DNA-binding protein [Pedobacter gandavensis]
MRLYHTFSDAELGYLLKEGNQLAYIEIFNRYQPLLFLHASKKMRNDKSYKEISDELGICEETVRKQIKNALKILRTRLGLFHYLIPTAQMAINSCHSEKIVAPVQIR